jgi:ferritin-like metal-binding protein YciE
VNREQLNELLYQAMETELGGEQVYLKALECAQNADLKEEWEKYLAETREHQEILKRIFKAAGLDTSKETPGRKVVRFKAESLVKAMDMALSEAGKDAAQLVAAESVVEAETKDHQNWELLARAAEEVSGELKSALSEAYDEVGEQEAHHLFHTQGWARELWIESLGMAAALPPPEEQKSVETKIGAGRAEHQRDDYIG